MSLRPELGHLYHDGSISGGQFAIDAKEQLRAREINAREQRHLAYTNHVIQRARNICERNRKWEKINVARQMRCLENRTLSLEQSLAREAMKMHRHEQRAQELYGMRAPLSRSFRNKNSNSLTPTGKVQYSFGNKISKEDVKGDSLSSAKQDTGNKTSIAGGDVFGDLPGLEVVESPGRLSYKNTAFDDVDRKSLALDTADRDHKEEEDDETTQNVYPTGVLARPRNLRRRNEHVARALVRLYHKAEERKKDLAHAQKQRDANRLSQQKRVQQALVVLRGTPYEEMVEKLLHDLRFGRSTRIEPPSDHVTNGNCQPTSTDSQPTIVRSDDSKISQGRQLSCYGTDDKRSEGRELLYNSADCETRIGIQSSPDIVARNRPKLASARFPKLSQNPRQ